MQYFYFYWNITNLLLVLASMSCQHKEFIHRDAPIVIYESTYTLHLKKPNTNLQTEKLIPVINLQMDYIVISDGIRSYIRGINPAMEGEKGVSVNSTEILAYTNCEKGMGMTLDNQMNVVSVFKIKTHIFGESRNEELIVGEKVYPSLLLECKDGINMDINESTSLSKAINAGACYNLDRGMLKMKGVNEGIQIEVVLQKYEVIKFNFTRFDDLLEDNRNLIGENEKELFWN